MKKLIILGVALLLSNVVLSQKFVTRTGEVKFEASVPAFEEVAAKNSSVSSILDVTTGDFVALALVKAFKFKVPLMEEHFNENYMESSLFPKSTFKGKLIAFDVKKLSAAKMFFDLDGDLTIHGVTKKVRVKAAVTSVSGKIVVVSSFSVKPLDYNIKIPNLVRSKVAEDVKVGFNFTLDSK